MAKKIIIAKNDSAEKAIIKLLKVKEDEVILSVPNFSHLANALENFKLIRREADEASKRVTIESVDDMVIELARRADLDSINPFFDQHARKTKPLEPDTGMPATAVGEVSLDAIKEDIMSPSAGRRRRGRWLSVALLLALIGGGAYAAIAILPQARVTVVTQKMPWDYPASLLVSAAATTVDAEAGQIPGQLVKVRKNGSFPFPAGGKKQVSRKAKGTVTIYNAYSAAPQTLVASTRLETPDGKVFRLAENIVVPGAAVAGGKITPSSIGAAVVADRGGDAYNIGPVEKFTIPGFKHGPKFEKFFAESREPMQGGFTGESAYPTDADIQQAKTRTSALLEETLKLELKNQLPEGFTVADGAARLTVIKQTVNPDVNDKNEFSVSAEGEMAAIAFRAADVQAVVDVRIKNELRPDLRQKTSSLTYGAVQPDFAKGTMAVPVIYHSQLEYPLIADQLKQKMIGRSEAELRASLFALPGLASVKVSLWPFWVKRVPSAVDISIQ